MAFSSLSNTSSRIVVLIISAEDSINQCLCHAQRATVHACSRARGNVMPFVFDVKRAVAAHGVNMGCEHGDGFVDVCVDYLHSSSDY